MAWNLENYETVEERINKFYAKFPEGRILTDIYYHAMDYVVFKASVYIDDTLVSTGFASESSSSARMSQSFLENAETSAIGRALANYNFAKKGSRPSREEMLKATSNLDDNGNPISKPAPVSTTPPADDDRLRYGKQVMAQVYARYPDKKEANDVIAKIPTLYGVKGNLYQIPLERLKSIVMLLKAVDKTQADFITHLQSNMSVKE